MTGCHRVTSWFCVHHHQVSFGEDAMLQTLRDSVPSRTRDVRWEALNQGEWIAKIGDEGQ